LGVIPNSDKLKPKRIHHLSSPSADGYARQAENHRINSENYLFIFYSVWFGGFGG